MWVFIADFLNSNVSTGAAGIIALGLFAAPIIDMVKYVNYCDHKGQCVVNRLELKGYKADYDSSYYNASDMICFEAEIETKKYEVAFVKLDTLVYEDGKFLGAITCEFDGDQTEYIDNGSSYSISHYFKNYSTATLSFTYNYSGTYTSDLYYQILNKGTKLEYRPLLTLVNYVDGVQVGSFWYDYDENGNINWRESFI